MEGFCSVAFGLFITYIIVNVLTYFLETLWIYWYAIEMYCEYLIQWKCANHGEKYIVTFICGMVVQGMITQKTDLRHNIDVYIDV